VDGWIAWLLAAIALGAGEVMTTSFYLAPFAIGCLVAALVSIAGAGFGLAFLLFALVTVLCFAVVRPIARRHVTMPPHLRTGTAALVGRSAVVLERIANDEGVGCVRIDGEVWTARAYDDDQVIEAGERVQVVEIRGATALVAE
jgi:membrane protein implicated in regulation of membrane protease activity